ncbi:alkaline phosphatase, partial [Flavobacterium plurextorum]
YLKDRKYNVDNYPSKQVKKSLQDFSTKTFGVDLILNYSNFNVFFNRQIIKDKRLELAKVKQAFKEFLISQPQVKKVYTEEEILANGGNDYSLNFVAKGYDVTQNGDLVIVDKPGDIEYSTTGTSHGTIYSYDTHVPAIFYGWHIKKGESYDKKAITEIAPTIAQKIKVTFPNGTEAKVLQEVLDEKKK